MQTTVEKIEADLHLCLEAVVKIHELSTQCFLTMAKGMTQIAEEAKATEHEAYMKQFTVYTLEVCARQLQALVELTHQRLVAYLQADSSEEEAQP